MKKNTNYRDSTCPKCGNCNREGHLCDFEDTQHCCEKCAHAYATGEPYDYDVECLDKDCPCHTPTVEDEIAPPINTTDGLIQGSVKNTCPLCGKDTTGTAFHSCNPKPTPTVEDVVEELAEQYEEIVADDFSQGRLAQNWKSRKDWLIQTLTKRDAQMKAEGVREQTQTPPHVVFDLWCEDWEVTNLSPALADLQKRLKPDTKL